MNKQTCCLIVMVLFWCDFTNGSDHPHKISPGSLESAVNVVLLEMNEKDKAKLMETPKEELIESHRDLGKQIEKIFILKNSLENQKLYDTTCANCFCNERDVSMAIVCGAWNSLKGKDIYLEVSKCFIPAFIPDPRADSSKGTNESKP